MCACNPHAGRMILRMQSACTTFVKKTAMAKSKYPRPEYSRREVNRAGDTFVDPSASPVEKDHALAVIDNWRTSHNFPLNTFQMRLRRLAKSINPENLVAQRIKRLASIKLKLERFPDMNMAQIQDIGGCRAIMKDVSEVDRLVDVYKHNSRGLKHRLHKEQDYILCPKESGYRGVHLIYKYRSDKEDVYDDMRIEIQIRTLLQHAWATSVEIIGTFIKQSLKSSQGEEKWLRFFALVGSAMAITEGKPIVPGTTEDFSQLRKEISDLAAELDIEGHLTAFQKSIQVLSGENRIPNAHYYLMELDPGAGSVRIKAYTQTQLDIASADYTIFERRAAFTNRDVVLVSADSLEALKLAFPNYYLDSEKFLLYLRGLINPTGQLSLF